MTFQSHIKQFERAVGRFVLIGMRAIIRRLPYSIFQLLTFVFTMIAWPVLAKKRRIATESLKIAYGHAKSPAEISQIASACFKNFGRGMIDLIYFIDHSQKIVENISISGKENLEQALAKGNGAIIVSAHFGNFILMYTRILKEGYKTNVIMRRTRDEVFEKYISGFRDEQGLQTIYDLPARKCVQQSLKALRSNEVLFILLDQSYGSDGRVFVDFFGKQAATATGPVVFSNRTGAPILPMFIRRERGLKSQITIQPPISLEEGEGQDIVVRNVAKISKIIEAQIRLYPHEWGGWMHKRWKSRTIEEQTIIDRVNEERAKTKNLNNRIFQKPAA